MAPKGRGRGESPPRGSDTSARGPERSREVLDKIQKSLAAFRERRIHVDGSRVTVQSHGHAVELQLPKGVDAKDLEKKVECRVMDVQPDPSKDYNLVGKLELAPAAAGERPERRRAFSKERFLEKQYRAVPSEDVQPDPERPGEYIAEIDGKEVPVSRLFADLGTHFDSTVHIALSPDGTRGSIFSAPDAKHQPHDWEEKDLQGIEQLAAEQDQLRGKRERIRTGDEITDLEVGLIDDTVNLAETGYRGRVFAFSPDEAARPFSVTSYWGYEPSADEAGRVANMPPIEITRAAKPEDRRVTHDAVFAWQRDLMLTYTSVANMLDQYQQTISEIGKNRDAHRARYAEDDAAKQTDFDTAYAEYQQAATMLLNTIAELMELATDWSWRQDYPDMDALNAIREQCHAAQPEFVMALRRMQDMLPDSLTMKKDLPSIELPVLRENIGKGLLALGDSMKDVRDARFVQRDGTDTEAARWDLQNTVAFFNQGVEDRILSETDLAVEALGGQEYAQFIQEMKDLLTPKDPGLQPHFQVNAAVQRRGKRPRSRGKAASTFEHGAIISGLRVAGDDVFFDATQGGQVTQERMTKEQFIDRVKSANFELIDGETKLAECTLRDELRGLRGSDNIEPLIQYLTYAEPFGSAEYHRRHVDSESNEIGRIFRLLTTVILREYVQTFGALIDGVGVWQNGKIGGRQESIGVDLSIGDDLVGELMLTGNKEKDEKAAKTLIETVNERLKTREKDREAARREATIEMIALADVKDVISWYRGTLLPGALVDGATYAQMTKPEAPWTAEDAAKADEKFRQKITEYVDGFIPEGFKKSVAVLIADDQPMGKPGEMKVLLSAPPSQKEVYITGDRSADKKAVDFRELAKGIVLEQQKGFMARLYDTKATSMETLIQWYRGAGNGKLDGSDSGFPFVRADMLAEKAELKGPEKDKELAADTALRLRLRHYIGIFDIADVRIAQRHLPGDDSIQVELIGVREGVDKGDVIEVFDLKGTDEDDKILKRLRAKYDRRVRDELEPEWLEENKRDFLAEIQTLPLEDTPKLIQYMNKVEGVFPNSNVCVEAADFSDEEWEAYVKELEPLLIKHAYLSLGVDETSANFSIAIAADQNAIPTEYGLKIDVRDVCVNPALQYTGEEKPEDMITLQEGIARVHQNYEDLAEFSSTSTLFDKSQLRPSTIVRYTGPDRVATEGMPYLRNGQEIVIMGVSGGDVLFTYEDARRQGPQDADGNPTRTNVFDQHVNGPGGTVLSADSRLPVDQFLELFGAGAEDEGGRMDYSPVWMVENMPTEFSGQDVTHALGMPDSPQEFFWAGSSVGDLEPGMRVVIHEHKDTITPPVLKLMVDGESMPIQVEYMDLAMDANAQTYELIEDGEVEETIRFLEQLTGDTFPRDGNGKLDVEAFMNRVHFDDTGVGSVTVQHYAGGGAKRDKRGMLIGMEPYKPAVKPVTYTETYANVSIYNITKNGVTLTSSHWAGGMSSSMDTISPNELLRRFASGQYKIGSSRRPFSERKKPVEKLSREQEVLQNLAPGDEPAAEFALHRHEFWSVTPEMCTLREHEHGDLEQGVVESRIQKELERHGMGVKFYTEMSRYNVAWRRLHDTNGQDPTAKALLDSLKAQMNADPEVEGYTGPVLEQKLREKQRATQLWFASQDPTGPGVRQTKLKEQFGADFIYELEQATQWRSETAYQPTSDLLDSAKGRLPGFEDAATRRANARQKLRELKQQVDALEQQIQKRTEELKRNPELRELKPHELKKQLATDPELTRLSGELARPKALWEHSMRRTSWAADWNDMRSGKILLNFGFPVQLATLIFHPESRNKMRSALGHNVLSAVANMVPGLGREHKTSRTVEVHPAFASKLMRRGVNVHDLVFEQKRGIGRFFRDEGDDKRRDFVYYPDHNDRSVCYQIKAKTFGGKVTDVVMTLLDHPQRKAGINHPRREYLDKEAAEVMRREAEARGEEFDPKKAPKTEAEYRIHLTIDEFIALMDRGRQVETEGGLVEAEQRKVTEDDAVFGMILRGNNEPIQAPTPFRAPVRVMNGAGEVMKNPARTPAETPAPAWETRKAEGAPGPLPFPTGPEPARRPVTTEPLFGEPVRTVSPEILAEEALLTPDSFPARFKRASGRVVNYEQVHGERAFADDPTLDYFAKAMLKLVNPSAMSHEKENDRVDMETAVAFSGRRKDGRTFFTLIDPKSPPAEGSGSYEHRLALDQISVTTTQEPGNSLHLADAVAAAGFSHGVNNILAGIYDSQGAYERSMHKPRDFASSVTPRAMRIASHIREGIPHGRVELNFSDETSLTASERDIMAAASLVNLLFPNEQFIVIRDDDRKLEKAMDEYSGEATLIVIRDGNGTGTQFPDTAPDDDFFRAVSSGEPSVIERMVKNAQSARFASDTSYEQRVAYLLSDEETTPPPSGSGSGSFDGWSPPEPSATPTGPSDPWSAPAGRPPVEPPYRAVPPLPVERENDAGSEAKGKDWSEGGERTPVTTDKVRGMNGTAFARIESAGRLSDLERCLREGITLADPNTGETETYFISNDPSGRVVVTVGSRDGSEELGGHDRLRLLDALADQLGAPDAPADHLAGFAERRIRNGLSGNPSRLIHLREDSSATPTARPTARPTSRTASTSKRPAPRPAPRRTVPPAPTRSADALTPSRRPAGADLFDRPGEDPFADLAGPTPSEPRETTGRTYLGDPFADDNLFAEPASGAAVNGAPAEPPRTSGESTAKQPDPRAEVQAMNDSELLKAMRERRFVSGDKTFVSVTQNARGGYEVAFVGGNGSRETTTYDSIDQLRAEILDPDKTKILPKPETISTDAFPAVEREALVRSMPEVFQNMYRYEVNTSSRYGRQPTDADRLLAYHKEHPEILQKLSDGDCEYGFELRQGMSWYPISEVTQAEFGKVALAVQDGYEPRSVPVQGLVNLLEKGFIVVAPDW